MTTEDRDAAIKCSTGALTMIYYVIVGLAITEALHNAFHKEGEFLGATAFLDGNLPKTLLLLALLLTTFRFVHGASMHLGVLSDQRYKPLVDFVGFFLQASMFYLMAFSLGTLSDFSWFFIIMLLLDTGWVVVLRLIRYQGFGHTEVQWLVSNGVLVALLAGILAFQERIPNLLLACLILAAAVGATVWDYVANRDFYFPRAEAAA